MCVFTEALVDNLDSVYWVKGVGIRSYLPERREDRNNILSNTKQLHESDKATHPRVSIFVQKYKEINHPWYCVLILLTK